MKEGDIMPNDFEHTKWFHFEDGSNPYGILGGRQDLFFKMVVSWQPEMINNSTFKCPEKPTEAYYHPVSYQFKKAALVEFAKEWQRAQSNISSSYEDLIWWQAFFDKYGKKYGCLTEFHENGIC